MVHPLYLALAASILIDPGNCRQTRASSASWTADGRGSLSVSTDAHTTGDVTLTCRIPVPPGVTSVTLELDAAMISFLPAGSRTIGSGLLLLVGRTCRAELIRVAGEDWIEVTKRAWSLPVAAGTRSLEVRVTARDSSSADPLRIDLRRLRLTAGAVAGSQACGNGSPVI
jgi:hypothetical protein